MPRFFSKTPPAPPEARRKLTFAVIMLAGMAFLVILPAPYGDWDESFYPVARHFLDPYSVRTFMNPPWTALLLAPFGWFSEMTSATLNACLSILVMGLLVYRRKGDALALLLTLTSFPFIGQIANGNNEWMPALGFLLAGAWGVPFVLTKPQSGLLAIIPWFLSSRKKLLFLLPTLGVIVLSFVLWGNWVAGMLANLGYVDRIDRSTYQFNASLFPWLVPVGIALFIYVLVRRPAESDMYGILATICISPYFASHSLMTLFAMLSVSHRRISILLWVALWLGMFVIPKLILSP